MSRRSFDMAPALTGAVFVALSAALGCVVFTTIATPDQLQQRLAHIDAVSARAQSLEDGYGDPKVFAPGTVCDDPAQAASATLRQRLSAAAANSGVTLTNVQAAPGAANTDAKLVPIRLQLDANGRYDSALRLVAELAASQPEIFLDTVDLRSMTSSVDLKLTGTLYCWTSDHL